MGVCVCIYIRDAANITGGPEDDGPVPPAPALAAAPALCVAAVASSFRPSAYSAPFCFSCTLIVYFWLSTYSTRR